MTQSENRKPEEHGAPQPRKPAAESKPSFRSSSFKYYIHDTVEALRLQLIGQLSETQVPELSGCWATAKTTLGARKVLLDLRNLRVADDPGKEWIISMASEGALLLPETFLRDGLANRCDALSEGANVGFWARVLCFLRGSRPFSAQSSTQAQ